MTIICNINTSDYLSCSSNAGLSAVWQRLANIENLMSSYVLGLSQMTIEMKLPGGYKFAVFLETRNCSNFQPNYILIHNEIVHVAVQEEKDIKG